MKKLFILLLATLLTCSCGTNSGSNANNPSNPGNPITGMPNGSPSLSGPFEITITGSSDLNDPEWTTELIETNFASQGNGKYSFSPDTIMLELFGQMPQQWVTGTQFGIVNGNCATGSFGADNFTGGMQVTGNNLSGTATDSYSATQSGTFVFTGTWSDGAFSGTWTASSTGQVSCGGSGTFVAKPAKNITGNYTGTLITPYKSNEITYSGLIQGDGTGSATGVMTKYGSPQVVYNFAGTQIANYMQMADTSNPEDIRTVWYDTANDRLWVTWGGGPPFWGYLTH